jgi:hypothetical protein
MILHDRDRQDPRRKEPAQSIGLDPRDTPRRAIDKHESNGVSATTHRCIDTALSAKTTDLYSNVFAFVPVSGHVFIAFSTSP